MAVLCCGGIDCCWAADERCCDLVRVGPVFRDSWLCSPKCASRAWVETALDDPASPLRPVARLPGVLLEFENDKLIKISEFQFFLDSLQ